MARLRAGIQFFRSIFPLLLAVATARIKTGAVAVAEETLQGACSRLLKRLAGQIAEMVCS